MKTFLYKSLTCLLALSLVLGAPSRVFAAVVSDEKLVSLSDGAKAFLFKLSGDTDGDLFVVVTAGKSRTVYRPVADPLSDPDLAAYRGVVLPSGTKATKFEVIGLKTAVAAPASSTAQTAAVRQTVAEASFGDFTLKLDMEGDAKKGYDLAASAKVKDVGSFTSKGRWDPAKPSEPLTFEADNVYKTFLESSLGKAVGSGALKPSDKIYAKVTLPSEWVEALKNPDLLQTAAGRSKVSAAKGLACEVRVPFMLKLDPKRDPFAMTARIDPVGKTAKLEVDAGQSWAKPFGILPVTFSAFEATTDFSFSTVKVKTSGDIDFVVKTPVELEATLTKGASAKVKLVTKPTADFVVESLKLAGIPLDLTDIVTPILKKIKIGTLDIGPFDLSGALPDVNLKFTIDTPKWVKDFDIKLPKVDLSMPSAFAISVGKIVFPELKANLELIALGLSLEILTGKWRLIDLDLDFGSVDLDAEGSPEKGFALKGAVTLNGVGTFNVDGSWSAATATAPIILKVDNAAKDLFEKSLGKALPAGWLKLGDKITATLTLEQAWIDDLKRGKKAATKTAEPKRVDIKLSMPLTLKIDPTKDPFALTAKLDPLAKTTALSLDSGQTWKNPFGYLPVTFSRLDVTSDLAFETFTVGASGDMDFFKPVPLALDATVKAGKVTAFKLKATPPSDFLSATLKGMKIPVDIDLPLEEIKWAFEEFLKHVKFGELNISAPDFDAKLADLGLKFSVDMPNWKHDFDLKLPGVSLMDLDKIAVDLGDLVFPVIVANLPKITAGLVFAGISGRWNLGTLDLGIASADLWAEGDAAMGYALTGKVTVAEAGDFKVDGFWSPSAPLDPIVFTADNILKTALEKSLSQMIAKDALTLGDKVTVKVGLPPSWLERLKRGGRAAPKAAAGAAKEEFTLEASMPFTAKIDPKKSAFKFTAKTEPLKKTVSVAFDDGQSWDKPLDLLPVKFDKLAVTTDTGLTALTVAAAGKLDFLVSCDVNFAASSKNGAAASYTAKLTPAPDTNIVKVLLNGRVPPASQTLVDALLPNTVIEELTVAMDAKKAKPDVRLKFTMSKGTLTQKFDVLVKDANMADPADFASKAAPQIIDQLAGGAIGEATTEVLDKLGLAGDWTLVDINLADKIILFARAKGAPKTGYDLSADLKPLAFEKFSLKGRWEPAKPKEPIKLSSDKNPFKPLFDQTIGKQLPQGWVVLKDEFFVIVTLPTQAIATLQGGSGGKASSIEGFDVEAGFPVKLKIDPTKSPLDMIASVLPMQAQAKLALAEGQTWEKPYGFIPATFNTLSGASDPSFTMITIHGEGSTDFIEGQKLEFALDLVMAQGKKPDLKIQTKPTPGLIKAIIKKAKVPASMASVLPEIKLERFEILADFQAVAVSGQVPDAEIRFSVDHALTGKFELQAKVPAGNLNDPAKFVKLAAEQVAEQLSALAKLGPNVLKNAGEAVGDAAKDPVGTGKKVADKGEDVAEDIGKGVLDFASDPDGEADRLAKEAFDAAENLGRQLFDEVSSQFTDFANDPLGTAQKKAEEALGWAKSALDAAEDLLSDALDLLSDIADAIWGLFTDDDEEEAEEAREEAEREKAAAEWRIADAQRGLREVEKLKNMRSQLPYADTESDLDDFLSAVKQDHDISFYMVDMFIMVRPLGVDFNKEVEAKRPK
ncbi:MAG: Uncharacterized protein FD126_252, partial [Elusimicrobia bacterium]